MLRHRRAITEFECRYYIKQLLSALNYLQRPEHSVLHRDLKLGNLFLASKMRLKIGDFGLATQLRESVDLRSSICGTPNYMAPEVCSAAHEEQMHGGGECGYSFAADVWAVGVIMYTLVVGRPPFETAQVEDTYKLIKNVEYTFPTAEVRMQLHLPPLSYEFEDLVTLILQRDPFMRPSLKQIESHAFFTHGDN